MAALGEEHEWFIGRDGQQFGPVTSGEMGKLIELGHLKPADLVWRAGFADWQPADTIFPRSVLEPPAPPPPAQSAPARPEPAPGNAEKAPVAAAPTAAPVRPAAAQEPAPVRPTAPREQPLQVRAAAAAATPQPVEPIRLEDVAADIKAAHGPEEARAAPVSVQPSLDPPSGTRSPAPRPARDYSEGDAGADRLDDRRAPAHHRKAARQEHTPLDHSRRRQRRKAAIMLATVSLLLVGVAGGAAYIWRGDLERVVSGLATPAPEAASVSTAEGQSNPPETKRAGEGASAGRIVDMQSNPLWQFVRAEFPEWHADRQREAGRLAAEGKDGAAINRYLAEQLIGLRRNHADDALGASPEGLKKIAQSFVDNLLTFNRQSVDACYSLISHGEASNAVLALMSNKELQNGIDKQLITVFEAVSEGRKQRVRHLPPGKSDYDLLVQELGRKGWTDLDLQVFSDSRALGRAQPVVVCRLVREWFEAHLALEDPGAQVRLLVESLRPVVGG